MLIRENILASTETRMILIPTPEQAPPQNTQSDLSTIRGDSCFFRVIRGEYSLCFGQE